MPSSEPKANAVGGTGAAPGIDIVFPINMDAQDK